ncbi:uncharacterized protein F4822DRAFT_366415 [Hypoxylon trugodes]|uniref:uncharacterized protein n=1 Tax=Hypoxylon trugodes TaxID=326681 RepID=UPI0021A0AAA7|nr:uncharacterized protein F4822DRAFT_366415 [Hypoxylon trugodes]KAI1384541.1 hypothetical protein F4822DRAFT_366415 [Hypoxylon trugodes]
MSPSRAESPAPPTLGGSTHQRQHSFDSYFSDNSDKSDKEKVIICSPLSQLLTSCFKSNIPQTTHGSSRFDYRRAFTHHHHSSDKQTNPPSKPHSPTVNVYTHCGRHTDQYLLGGWSNLIKGPFKREKD